jgi:hypothetical protein
VGRWRDCELEAAEVDDGVTRYSRHHRGEKDEGDMWGHYVSGREGREVRVGAVVAGLGCTGKRDGTTLARLLARPGDQGWPSGEGEKAATRARGSEEGLSLGCFSIS